MDILQRGGKVRTTVVANRKKTALQAEVKKHVEAGAALYTDALLSYESLAGQYAHKVVDRAVEYVNGRIPHQRPRKLLVASQAQYQRDLR